MGLPLPVRNLGPSCQRITSAPYHPSSNGLAERAVQTFKNGIKRTQGSTIQERLSKFLFTYRITPHTTTGIAPSQLLMNRRLRSRLDSLFPDTTSRVEKQQVRQAEQHDNSKPLRTFTVGDTVYTRDFSTPSPTWIQGKVTKVTGPLSYHVELSSGCVVRRHVDAIRRRNLPVEPTPEPTSPTSSNDDLYLPDVQSTPTAAPVIPATPVAPATPTVSATSPAQITPPHLTLPPPHPTRRIRRRAYSTSVRKSSRHRPPPARFGWK